jgi:hypothetical protein
MLATASIEASSIKKEGSNCMTGEEVNRKRRYGRVLYATFH